jgi:tetratricopeptide (TPR) repeat protein
MSPPLGSRGLLRGLAIQSQNCEGALAGRHSKTVAFVAFLALTTFGALATASAQPADINAINKAFQDHYARGNYSAAQIEAQELERLAKARFGADHPYYAVALNKLAIVVRAQGKYTEAEGLYKRALAIREKTLGANHSDVGQSLHNLAYVYADQWKYGEAEELYKRALAVREQARASGAPPPRCTCPGLYTRGPGC